MLFLSQPYSAITHGQVLSGGHKTVSHNPSSILDLVEVSIDSGRKIRFTANILEQGTGLGIVGYKVREDGVTEDVTLGFQILVICKKLVGEDSSIKIELPNNVFTQLGRKFAFPLLPNKIWRDHEPDFLIVQVQVRNNSEDRLVPQLMTKVADGIESELASSLGESMATGGDFVVLKMSDGEMQVHKKTLTTRSSYFRTVFTAGMKEEREGRVEIPDFGVEVMTLLLLFIHGEIAVRPALRKAGMSALMDAFGAADKYGMESLRKLVGLVLVEKAQAVDEVDAANVVVIHQFLTNHAECELAGVVGKCLLRCG